MSFAEAPDPLITAADFLAFNESQLVRYLESNRCVEGGFNISNVANLETLSKSQRDELASRLRAAAEIATASRSIDVDALFARLTSIEGGQDGSGEPRCLQPPAQPRDRTESPITNEVQEAAFYHQLIQDGGRPVCPLEVLLHILAEPAASHEPVMPWLSRLDPARRDDEIESVFLRQLSRWWDFWKWQSDNRGTADGDGGFPAFLASQRSVYERMGAHRMVRDGSFDETTLRMWQQMPKRRLLSDDQEFPAYREAVKRRLAPHNFKRPLQLMKDPRKQTEWTTWLEYLNFEQWWLERYAAAAEAGEWQYHQAWERLLKAVRPLPKRGMGLHGTKDNFDFLHAASAAEASGSSQTRQRRQNTKTVASAEQSANAQADLDPAKRAIDDFIRDTARYRRAEAAVYHQKSRVQWVLKEARVIEAEVPQRRGTAKNNSNSDAGETKKRRHNADDDGIASESRSKRSRRGGGGKGAVPDAVSGQPRRSQRIQSQSASAIRSVK